MCREPARRAALLLAPPRRIRLRPPPRLTRPPTRLVHSPRLAPTLSSPSLLALAPPRPAVLIPSCTYPSLLLLLLLTPSLPAHPCCTILSHPRLRTRTLPENGTHAVQRHLSLAQTGSRRGSRGLRARRRARRVLERGQGLSSATGPRARAACRCLSARERKSERRSFSSRAGRRWMNRRIARHERFFIDKEVNKLEAGRRLVHLDDGAEAVGAKATRGQCAPRRGRG